MAKDVESAIRARAKGKDVDQHAGREPVVVSSGFKKRFTLEELREIEDMRKQMHDRLFAAG